jgi:hypothetical protein
MGVGKSMKTFISAMTEQTGMGGYGSKIKSTPMGPFRWNDLTQLWENVNNGMVMNNVSFQDMFMIGYETGSGDNATGTIGELYDWGTLSFSFDTSSPTTIYAKTGTATETVNLSNAIDFTTTNTMIGQIFYNVANGITFTNISSRKTIGGPSGTLVIQNILTTGFTAAPGDRVRIQALMPGGGWTAGNSGYLNITDTISGALIDRIPFVVGPIEIEPP